MRCSRRKSSSGFINAIMTFRTKYGPVPYDEKCHFLEKVLEQDYVPIPLWSISIRSHGFVTCSHTICHKPFHLSPISMDVSDRMITVIHNKLVLWTYRAHIFMAGLSIGHFFWADVSWWPISVKLNLLSLCNLHPKSGKQWLLQ